MCLEIIVPYVQYIFYRTHLCMDLKGMHMFMYLHMSLYILNAYTYQSLLECMYSSMQYTLYRYGLLWNGSALTLPYQVLVVHKLGVFGADSQLGDGER